MNRIRQTLSGLTFTKNIRYEVIIEKNVPQNIMGDDFRIEQILKNLVSNAVKFTEKGQIEVFVKRQDKNVLLFQVRDTGIGISKENIDGLFTKFYQINTPYTKTYAGTGLGLAISKELSELMGGRIWCESEPGKGSSFFFTIRFEIPDEQPELSEKEKLKHSDEINQPKRALRILLAEDDYLSNKTITHFLKHEGHTIRHAENGKEALALLESENFDLVLMDVQMPEMDGIEATKQIRKAISDNKMNSKIPIIAITALAMRGDKERFLDAGMNDYISKPIDYDLLFDKIDRLC
jgi:CheY-like chemotaxis protein